MSKVLMNAISELEGFLNARPPVQSQRGSGFDQEMSDNVAKLATEMATKIEAEKGDFYTMLMEAIGERWEGAMKKAGLRDDVDILAITENIVDWQAEHTQGGMEAALYGVLDRLISACKATAQNPVSMAKRAGVTL